MNPVSKFTPKIRREKTALSNSDLARKKEDTVQVFCRLRPLKHDEESTCIKLLSPTVLHLKTPAEARGVRKEVECTFKHIFTGFATQNEVFQHVAYPLLEGLLQGKNGLLFTYGVTGSGKTYTLAGDHSNPGIMPKCIHTLFNSIGDFQAPKFVIKPDKMNYFEIQSDDDVAQDKWNELRATKSLKTPKKINKDKTFINDGMTVTDLNQNNLYSVFVSYVEIYNNIVYDLLDEGKTLESKILREDARKNMYVNGVVETEVKSAEEAFELFNIAQKRKRMGNTVLNAVSSRSHSIFNIRVVQFQQVAHNEEGQQVVPDGNLLKVSQLSLVDLAGSERTNRTKNTGQLLREASQINKSLMTLRTCLEVLRKNQTTGTCEPVPYRDSKLTLLLKNYFEGEGNVEMIVCVNPSVEDFEENIQVMNFAETTKNVQISASESRYNTPLAKRTIQKKGTTSHKNQGASTIRPKLPIIKLSFLNLEESKTALDSICNVLKTRIQNHNDLNREYEKRENAFRKRLLEIQQEYTLGKSEIKSVRAQYRKEKHRTSNLETKLADMEVYHKELLGRNAELQEEIHKLRNIITEKDLKITKNFLEKEKTKQKLALQTEKMTHELDAKLRRQREHLQKEMKAKESKIQKVREILDKDIPPEVPTPKEPLHDYNPQQTPKMPPELKKKPVTTPGARRRRSRSAGEVWLEHNSVKPVALGTVLQPTMKKRKSVTKLSKASDITNPKQSKYCLIAQEQDTEGELETKVYKGDILPTCGGGAQVIFNDVEKLRQESPTTSK